MIAYANNYTTFEAKKAECKLLYFSFVEFKLRLVKKDVIILSVKSLTKKK